MVGGVDEAGGEIGVETMQVYIIAKASHQAGHDDGRSTGQLYVSQDGIKQESSRKGSSSHRISKSVPLDANGHYDERGTN